VIHDVPQYRLWNFSNPRFVEPMLGDPHYRINTTRFVHGKSVLYQYVVENGFVSSPEFYFS
jgi:hypothetical protein